MKQALNFDTSLLIDKIRQKLKRLGNITPFKHKHNITLLLSDIKILTLFNMSFASASKASLIFWLALALVSKKGMAC